MNIQFHKKIKLRNLAILAGSIFTIVNIATTSLAQISSRQNYKIRSGDILEMTILQESEMKSKIRVDIDGTLYFPLIGKIRGAGKSVSELHNILYERYDKDYLVNPQISLQIFEYAQRRVRVRGKVNRPGFVIIPPEEEFNIMDVIAAAGDISASGNDRKVELHRANSDGSFSIRVIDLSQANRSPELAKLYLSNNDQVVVFEKLF